MSFGIEIMISVCQTPLRRSHLAWCGLALALLLGPATASDDALERERLVAAVRQLNLLDDLVDAATAEEIKSSRYHFDYARLRADLRRVRDGIEDYLTPKRAQPRDLSQIADTYRLDAPAEVAP